jgi:phage/plasmid-associated DNA primase
MKTPTPEDLTTAAEWLSYYDENDGENSAACQRVAAWLVDQACAIELRALCRKAGVPVAQIRAKTKAHLASLPQVTP